MNKVVTTTTRILSTLLTLAIGTGCGTNPFDSDTASSSVTFDLAGARTTAGVFLCSEADLAELIVAPSGDPSRVQQEQIGAGDPCEVTFSVTVPRGDVQFTGELLGRDRPLMRGSPPVFEAKDDDFVVRIGLDEIEALDVRTRTLGLGGPSAYTYEFEGSDTRFPIGREAADTVAALAGGARFVTLHPGWCAVVNGPARREVMIPTDERDLGATLFEIDCNQGGGVTVVTQTQGTGGASTFTVMVGSQSGPIGRNDTRTFSGVTPGPLAVTLDTGGTECTPNDVTPPPHFLRSGGTLTVRFLMLCTTVLLSDSIRVVTRPVMTPGSGEIETFTATTTDANSLSQSLPLTSVSDSVLFFVAAGANPHSVRLTPTGTCTVQGAPTRSVTLPASGFSRVVFDVGC